MWSIDRSAINFVREMETRDFPRFKYQVASQILTFFLIFEPNLIFVVFKF